VKESVEKRRAPRAGTPDNETDHRVAAGNHKDAKKGERVERKGLRGESKNAGKSSRFGGVAGKGEKIEGEAYCLGKVRHRTGSPPLGEKGEGEGEGVDT